MDKAKTMKRDLQKIREGLEVLKNSCVLRGMCFFAPAHVQAYLRLKAQEKDINVKLGYYWFDSLEIIKSHDVSLRQFHKYGFNGVFEQHVVEEWYAPRFKLLDELIEELDVEGLWWSDIRSDQCTVEEWHAPHIEFLDNWVNE